MFGSYEFGFEFGVGGKPQGIRAEHEDESPIDFLFFVFEVGAFEMGINAFEGAAVRGEAWGFGYEALPGGIVHRYNPSKQKRTLGREMFGGNYEG